MKYFLSGVVVFFGICGEIAEDVFAMQKENGNIGSVKDKLSAVISCIHIKDIKQEFASRYNEELSSFDRLMQVPEIKSNVFLVDQFLYAKEILDKVLDKVNSSRISVDDNELLSELSQITDDGFYASVTIFSRNLEAAVQNQVLALRDSFWQLLFQGKELVAFDMINACMRLPDLNSSISLLVASLKGIYSFIPTDSKKSLREVLSICGKDEEAFQLLRVDGYEAEGSI